MKDFIYNYFSEVLTLAEEMAPWLLLGLVFAGLLKAYFPQDRVIRYMGKSNFRSVMNAAILGVPMPLCSCGVIPAGISLYKNGASKGATNSFLISTPQTGVDSIFATYSMLGWPFAILRPLIAFITGITGGVITNLMTGKKQSDGSGKFSNMKMDLSSGITTNNVYIQNRTGALVPKKKHRLLEAANYAFVELLQDIGKWLIIGFFAAALIAVLLPDNFFSSFKGYGLVEILVVLAASAPLYICATGSIPIAAVLLMKGVSPGAAMVFLMAGPATNIATMTVIGKIMGKKNLFAYLISIIGGAIIFGLLMNWFIPTDWLMSKMSHNHDHNHQMLPSWLEVASAIVLTIALIGSYIIERIKKSSKMKENYYTILRVEGMSCSHCEASVTKNLLKLSGVEEVLADKNRSEVRIKGENLNLKEIEQTVNELGYQYKGCTS